ncbi:MAG: nitrous oxide-stimulated promoter family protein [Dehalococcoidia bacterium]|nr:nitrous oxide-stimulated promoter family protein [Dehalococcoidia bacterium]
MHPRIKRESKTVKQMIELYCRKHHSSNGLCPECLSLMEYVHQRLERCPFQGGKTTCAKCPVHCYDPAMRKRILVIMRYSGPRMLYRHPVATLWHLIDGRRQKPVYRRDEKLD